MRRKKEFEKAIAVIIMVLLTFVFSACGTEAKASEADSTDTEVTELTDLQNEFCELIRGTVTPVKPAKGADDNAKVSILKSDEDVIPHIVKYYKAFFGSDDEIHYLIDKEGKTTTRVEKQGDGLNIQVFKYVNGEENNAEKLASGDQIGEYQGNIKTEEVKAVDKNDSTKKSDKSDKDKDKKSDQSNKSDSKDKKSSDSKSNSGSSSKSGTSSNSGSNSSGSSSSGSSGSSSSSSSGSSSGSSSSGSSSSGSSGSGSSSSTPAVHVHNWVSKTKTIHHDATGHYENKWVQDSAAWDETVTTYTYEMHMFCRDCGAMDPSAEHLEAHIEEGGTGGYYSDTIEIPHTSTVHHDATGHNESVWVQDSAAWDETVTYYVCSGCGATQ